MKKWEITADIHGWWDGEVEAKTEAEALEKGKDDINMDLPGCAIKEINAEELDYG